MMTTTQYCVFWIPSTSHQAPAILPEFKDPAKLPRKELDKLYDEFVDPENLSDEQLAKRIEFPSQKTALYFLDDDNKPMSKSSFGSSRSVPSFCRFEIDPTDGVFKNHQRLQVTIKVNDEQHKDIILTYINSSKNERGEVSLSFIDACKNGMLYYSYTYDNDNPYQKAIHIAIPKAAYHLIKRFFHRHEYHSREKDSLLEAYIKPHKINIRECDSKPLQHYLKEFEIILSNRKEDFQAKISIANQFDIVEYMQTVKKEKWWWCKKKREAYRRQIFERLDTHRNYRQRIESLCYKMLGYGIYFETLLKSWYNSNHNTHWVHRQQLFLASDWHGYKANIKYANKNTIERQLNQAADAKKMLHRISINGKHAIASIANIRQQNQYRISNDLASLNLFDFAILGNREARRNVRLAKLGVGITVAVALCVVYFVLRGVALVLYLTNFTFGVKLFVRICVICFICVSHFTIITRNSQCGKRI